VAPSTPTVAPSTKPPLTSILCPHFDAINTSSANQNTAICSFYACSYELTISSCPDTLENTTCSGDQLIRLFDDDGTSVAVGDDSCGICAAISYKPLGSFSTCQRYHLHQGCYKDWACSGQILVSGLNVGFYAPSNAPTVSN
jgi:hypothetical protein